MALTSQDVLQLQTETAETWQGPLFVVGMWRSGTSLLFALLNKHPQIALMYEGDLSLLRPLFWFKPGKRKWFERWQFWNQAPQRHELDGDQITADTLPLRVAMEKAYRLYADQKGARIWGDKSPSYHDDLWRLAQEFPDARFLVIWRDPSSICRSVIRAGRDDSWWARRGMSHRTLGGYKTMKAGCDRLRASGIPIHEINYEVLVKEPAKVMSGVCQFLNIPFVRSIASLDGADRSAIYEGRHHALVNGENIVSTLDRSEVLPANLKKKIDRYVCLWRSETDGQWPFVLFPPAEDGRKASLPERAIDGMLYRYFRAIDLLVVLIYCYAPLSILKRYRAARGR